jgi:hypothetical protein
MIMLRSPSRLSECASAVRKAKVKCKGQWKEEEEEKKEGKRKGGRGEEVNDDDAIKVSVSFVGG